jgi:dihydrofolate reductase
MSPYGKMSFVDDIPFAHGMRNEITIFQANREKNKWERRTNMRKLWVKAWMTLDGVFDADTMDHWWPPADEAAADEARRIEYIVEEYSKGDVYLLGRTTYEMLWPGWSTQTTGDGPGPILNRMKKYVVSTTLETAPWKESTIIRGNVVEEITKLKQQPGKDMIIDGSATLVQSLMGTDLIDEYRFLVVPYIMGSGRRFFPDGTPPTKLRLVESKMLSGGTLALIYQPDKK